MSKQDIACDGIRYCEVSVHRYDPQTDAGPRMVEYAVPFEHGMSVMDVLRYIQDNLDPSLAFECSCRIGLCEACWVSMNGKLVPACSTAAQPVMAIKPTREDAVARDLIVRPSQRSEWKARM